MKADSKLATDIFLVETRVMLSSFFHCSVEQTALATAESALYRLTWRSGNNWNNLRVAHKHNFTFVIQWVPLRSLSLTRLPVWTKSCTTCELCLFPDGLRFLDSMRPLYLTLSFFMHLSIVPIKKVPTWNTRWCAEAWNAAARSYSAKSYTKNGQKHKQPVDFYVTKSEGGAAKKDPQLTPEFKHVCKSTRSKHVCFVHIALKQVEGPDSKIRYHHN